MIRLCVKNRRLSLQKKSELILNTKKKKDRKEYYRIYMQNIRAAKTQNSKRKNLVAQRKSKQNARQDRGYKAKELVAQRKSKQNARQDRDYKAK